MLQLDLGRNDAGPNFFFLFFDLSWPSSTRNDARMKFFYFFYFILYFLYLCSLHALCYIPYACALHAMFVCLVLGYVCHAMCHCSPFVALSFFIVFWPNGWDSIQTLWSLSSSVHLGPHQRVWITPSCMSMFARFYTLCLCWPLQFKALSHLTTLAGLWLYGYIRCP